MTVFTVSGRVIFLIVVLPANNPFATPASETGSVTSVSEPKYATSLPAVVLRNLSSTLNILLPLSTDTFLIADEPNAPTPKFVSFAGIFRFSIAVPNKHSSPIIETFSGIVNSLSEEQSLNNESGSSSIELPRTAFVKDLQPSNALSPIFVTFTREISLIALFLNAASPIVVKVSGTIIFVIPQPSNAEFSIVFNPDGSLTEVNLLKPANIESFIV